MLLFNVEFPDRVFAKKSKSGESLYSSKELDKLWGYGYCWIGSVSFDSAGYVARYSMKKWERNDDSWYKGREEEFLRMSRRPGLGRAWFDAYGAQWYKQDFVIVNGVKCKPPRYYSEWFKKFGDAAVAERLRIKRVVAGRLDPDATGSRLIVREAVKSAAISFLKRSSEVN